jgi:uncharacterized membrane protein
MSLTHLHLVLNHFPMVGTILGIGLLAFAIAARKNDLAKATLGIFVLLAVISVAVYFTGEAAEEAIEHLPGFSESITERHEESASVATLIMTALGVLCLGALVAFRRKQLPRWMTVTSLVFAILTGGVMSYTAMLGGQVRHTEIRSDRPVDTVEDRE